LSDILIAPTFEQSELEREQQVVLQEIGQARDTPDDIIFDNLQSVIFPNQPLGWPILGEEATVSGFTPAHLRDYMGANYRAGSMTLVASGAVTHEAIVRLAEEKFAGLKAGTTPASAAAHYVGGDHREEQDLEQAHFVCAFPGVANDDPDYYTAQVYITALGGGMSSRLFQEAREKRGLCYSIYSFAHSFQDGGVVGVYAGTGEKEAADIAPVIAGEMAAIAQDANESEVARAKAQLRSSVLMGLERPSNRAEQIAGSMFNYGRVISPEEMMRKLDAVDVSAVRRFASRIMMTSQPSIAALGPIKKLESYESFAARFGSAGTRRAAE
jgi:predicted Zn-dependent peptidase